MSFATILLFFSRVEASNHSFQTVYLHKNTRVMKNSFAIRITTLRFFFSSAIISEEPYSEPH